MIDSSLLHRTCWLYVITHHESGNQYVGISVDPKRRWRDHKQHCKKQNTRFYNALRKHGHENFVFEVVEQLDSVQEAKFREISTIAELTPEYNSTAGGDGVWNPTEETRRKMSEGIRNSPLFAGRMAKAWETRRAAMTDEELSAFCSQVQANMTPEQKAQKSRKLSEAQAARTVEEEAERQRKRSETVANWTPEQKASYSEKLSHHNATRILSEDAQARVEAGAKQGGHLTGQLMKERLAAMSPEEYEARNKNLGTKLSAYRKNLTPEQKAAREEKRLATRAKNKALREQGLL